MGHIFTRGGGGIDYKNAGVTICTYLRSAYKILKTKKKIAKKMPRQAITVMVANNVNEIVLYTSSTLAQSIGGLPSERKEEEKSNTTKERETMERIRMKEIERDNFILLISDYFKEGVASNQWISNAFHQALNPST